MSNLSPTARVILGMLRLGATTGYEIKSKVELSTRFFWGASFGQIYPELKRLEAAGLVVSEQPTGGRRRREYRLTPAGERALHEWLADPGSDDFELRDETLLKLFFGDLLAPGELRDVIRGRIERIEELLALFHRIDELRVEGWERLEYPTRALHYGIEFLEWMAAWYRQAERELSAG